MQYTINKLRNEAFQQVYQVYKVFQDYFGDNRVDLQGIPRDEDITNILKERGISVCEDGSYEINEEELKDITYSMCGTCPFILVYWPQVTVTNENDKSIIIRDLYAKIELDSKGKIPTEKCGFTLNRATYSLEQWNSNYLHSHIPGIPKDNLQDFQRPCLGSGPIINTISSLKADLAEDFDELLWMLFCEELSRYVTVESLQGVPYKYLERVHNGAEFSEYRVFNYGSNCLSMGYSLIYSVFNLDSQNMLKDFTLYYLKHGRLSLNFKEGEFCIGMSHFDFIIDISNSFIDYFNSHFERKTQAKLCFSKELLIKTLVSNRKFYRTDVTRSLLDTNYIGQKVCDFKGHEIKLNIISDEEFIPQETIVLSHKAAMFILYNILKIINYHYSNEYTKRQHNIRSSATLPATTGQRVYYI